MSVPSPAPGSSARRLCPADGPGTDDPSSQPRVEEFDRLVRALLPVIREFSPYLSDLEAFRAATRMAEYRLRDEGALFWGRW